MINALFIRRWSTLTLLGLSLALIAVAFWTGLRARSLIGIVPAGIVIPAPAPSKRGTTQTEEVALENQVSIRTDADFIKQWQRSSSEPRTPVGERTMAALLAELAMHDPNRAMAIALAEGNLRLRDELRNAVLRGWASVFSGAATAWALAQPAADQRAAMEAVFSGAANQPEDAVHLASRLFAGHPELKSDLGLPLISALTEVGAYAAAARFATSDLSDNRTIWLNTTFYQWAAHQPEQALAGVSTISDSAARTAAFQGLVVGWAAANPSALAAYATQLPPGENRQQALAQALTQWVIRDPVAASQWIDRFDPNPDLDAGAMALANLPALAEHLPDVAVGWAQSIMDPSLRASTLSTLAQQERQRGSVTDRGSQ